MAKGPVLIEIDESEAPQVTPDTAPPVPDTLPQGAAMQQAAVIASRPVSRLARWFWGLLVSLVGFMISLAAYRFVAGLLASSPILGTIAMVLVGLFCFVLLLIAIKELSTLMRLRRIDRIQSEAVDALETGSLKQARDVVRSLTAVYSGREDTKWGRERLKEREGDVLDADGLIGLAEAELLLPLDARAQKEVEAAARRVATVTAIVPLALADVFTALTANLAMIRRIAEIYEGRSGTIGSWRLTRAVMSHLVATGAVAVGDDLIGSVAGGGVLSKVSRRFGEGMINGALTARVGVAAIEVCRPLPFHTQTRPSVTALVQRSLTGLFSRS